MEIQTDYDTTLLGIKRPAPWHWNAHDDYDSELRDVPYGVVTRQFYDLQDSAPLVCFGTLREIPIQLRHDPVASITENLSPEDLVTLKLVQLKDTFWVKIGNGEPFGCFTTKMAEGLNRLQSLTHACAECQGVECEGIVSFSAIKDARESLRKSKSFTKLTVDINLYGHHHSAKAAGDALMASQLFLQPPEWDLRSLVYDNPQVLKLPGLDNIDYLDLLDSEADENLEEPQQEASRADIEAILDHLPQHGFLRELSADGRITTDLVK
ncbi:hypothetical protein DM02DRAFT_29776 [Periconia macrospinosa]|uniref:Uncharacterized protein n=1 Tax=Periconia macrospinosa TaxID=97972 RepID=A0A2V1DNQ2_9PLEO|nr:hypothetical protein DM02DRAFT_29776 [Periconia macrospinosa]